VNLKFCRWANADSQLKPDRRWFLLIVMMMVSSTSGGKYYIIIIIIIFFKFCHPLCVCENWRGLYSNTTMSIKMFLVPITRKTTCFGTYWPSSGFLQENLCSYNIYCART